MLYRVDYMLAVQLAGFLAALIFSRRTADVPRDRLAYGYYGAIALLLVLRTSAYMGGIFLGSSSSNVAGAIFGDLLGFLFGALFGLAARRKDAREFLTHRAIVSAVCMGLSFTFAIAAIGKMSVLERMTEFFTQSGYSVTFLKFIISAEILGAVGLLLPWSVWPALIGLSIDMFGAVVTHVHNGDSINDSTGAIALLMRLAAVAVLLSLRPRARKPVRTVRTSMALTAAVMAVCLGVALSGAARERAHTQGIPSGAIPSPVAK